MCSLTQMLPKTQAIKLNLNKMKIFSTTLKIAVALSVGFLQQSAAQNSYFFPKATQLDTKIPTPEAFLGYPIGSYLTRHDQVVAYFDNLKRYQIGYT